MTSIALGRLRALPRPGQQALFTIGLAAVLAAIGLRAGGGLQLGRTTAVEMALQATGGVLAALAILVDDGRRRWGGATTALFGALAVLTALSILWSVQPSDTWLEVSRALAWAAAFAIGVVLARIAGAWWEALLAAVVISAFVICGYALLTKIFPGTFAENEIYARLREPYDYWNAVGLTAALAVAPCLWLGARRTGHSAVNALAYPVMTVLLLTMLLAYSRGALLAAVVGGAFWFAVVPLRLRGAAVLAAGSVGAVLVAIWAFAQDPLSEDRVALALRTGSGHELGVALVAVLLLELAAGLAIGFALSRRAPRPEARRRVGVSVLVGLALIPIVALSSLALSERGLGGSISEGWESLTDPDATTPPNEPGRLTEIGSVRARYWDQAIKIFKAHTWRGVGAGAYSTARFRHRKDTLVVRHAHGYAVQVAADLGLFGLAVSLALFIAWLLAARRSTGLVRSLPIGPRARRGPPAEPAPWTSERVGVVTLAATVVVFGVHSFVDWTWFVPGNAVPALLCAGWVAGRGPLAEAARDPRGLIGRARAELRNAPRALPAAAAILIALSAAWATWQPWRSAQAGNDALAALDQAQRDPEALERARELATKARDRNALSVEPLFERAVIETIAQRKDEARRALEEAVRLQPSNPVPWLRFAEFTLHQDNNPARTLELLQPALFLDPRSADGIALYLEASRRTTTTATP